MAPQVFLATDSHELSTHTIEELVRFLDGQLDDLIRYHFVIVSDQQSPLYNRDQLRPSAAITLQNLQKLPQKRESLSP